MKAPPKPRVRHPVSWSCAVQDLLYIATFRAEEVLLEEEFGKLTGFAWISASARFNERLKVDETLKREFFERTCFFIANEKPRDGASPKGLPVDRAEARLRLWLSIYGGAS